MVTHVVSPVRTPSLLRLARRILRPSASADRVTFAELPRVEIERVRGSAIPQRRLREASRPPEASARVEADAAVVYRPRIRASAEQKAP